MKSPANDILVMTWNGHDIFVSRSTGRFSALVCGHWVWGGSLDTLKRNIKKTDTFKPFKALAIREMAGDGGPEVDEYEIVGHDDGHWLVKGADGSIERLYKYTPLYRPEGSNEVLSALAERQEWRARADRERAAMDEKWNAVQAAQLVKMPET